MKMHGEYTDRDSRVSPADVAGRHLECICAVTFRVNVQRLMSATVVPWPSEIGPRENRLFAQHRFFRLEDYTYVLDNRKPS